MFLLVPAYPGCPGSKAVKRSLLLLLAVDLIPSVYTDKTTNEQIIYVTYYMVHFCLSHLVVLLTGLTYIIFLYTLPERPLVAMKLTVFVG